MGLKSLWLHKMRSGLTMLGITFGVCSVIAMLAIGEGASREAQEQIAKLGSHNIIVRSVELPSEESSSSTRSSANQYGLTYADAEHITTTLPHVEVLVPARRIRRKVSKGSRFVETDVVGTVPWYRKVTATTIVQGRFLSSVDLRNHANVCLLGQRTALALFPFGDALGSIVNVQTHRFRIVGIVSSLSSGNTDEGSKEASPDSSIYVPLTTIRSSFGETIINRSSGSFSVERTPRLARHPAQHLWD